MRIVLKCLKKIKDGNDDCKGKPEPFPAYGLSCSDLLLECYSWKIRSTEIARSGRILPRTEVPLEKVR